mmetsp:Transcript_38550/g.91058  ORF Transcript_38550/g.91058 Transcript_38550/m.91058 type:complete len:279 (+) Transcript_38550:83-919(+)
MAAARQMAAGALGGMIGLALGDLVYRKKEPWTLLPVQPPQIRLSIFAPPGGGKGTVCEKIVRDYGMVQISSGDIFRAEVKKGTGLGKELQKHMESGGLVPAEIANAIMVNAVRGVAERGKSYILDGCIREEANARLFVDNDLGPHVSIIMSVDREECVTRVSGRRVDPVTKKSYHVRYVQPENEEVEKRLVQREDDKPQLISKRFQKYEENLEGCLAPLYKTGKVVRVDGTGTPDEVYARVKVEIDRAMARSELEEVLKDGSKAAEALSLLAWLKIRS